ncbi:betaine aldehyde dehydrogenase 1, chloroplastic [Senna tora]|uniref:aminobutyraldehyde dehydrogenase n=1 Tax=Senna tora TaxID=362788 RepID=A0A834TQS8_9FABA|nr:betaine aldehyde dehydrogenase 1, chloroplastic [Senna tora]
MESQLTNLEAMLWVFLRDKFGQEWEEMKATPTVEIDMEPKSVANIEIVHVLEENKSVVASDSQFAEDLDNQEENSMVIDDEVPWLGNSYPSCPMLFSFFEAGCYGTKFVLEDEFSYNSKFYTGCKPSYENRSLEWFGDKFKTWKSDRKNYVFDPGDFSTDDDAYKVFDETHDDYRKFVKESIGVVTLFLSWNYFLLKPSWKDVLTFAVDGVAKVKPSELATLICWELSQICRDVGLPKNFLNILVGLEPDAGFYLAWPPHVDKIVSTGKLLCVNKISITAARLVKLIPLEVSGRNPIVVYEVIDLDKAAKWVLCCCCWINGHVYGASFHPILHDSIEGGIFYRLVKWNKLLHELNTNYNGWVLLWKNVISWEVYISIYMDHTHSINQVHVYLDKLDHDKRFLKLRAVKNWAKKLQEFILPLPQCAFDSIVMSLMAKAMLPQEAGNSYDRRFGYDYDSNGFLIEKIVEDFNNEFLGSSFLYQMEEQDHSLSVMGGVYKVGPIMAQVWPMWKLGAKENKKNSFGQRKGVE